MKKAFMILLAVMMTISVNAQKKTVALGKVNASSGISSSWATLLKQNMMEGLVKSPRINLFDLENLSTGGSGQDQLTRLKEEYHVDYLITATMTALSYKYSAQNGKSSYSATMEYTTTVTDTETGETVKVMSEKHYGSSSKNADEAYRDCFGLIKRDMDNLVEACFPLTGTIQLIEESHPKKGARTVFVDLGSALGIASGDLMEVFKVREIAGREIPTKIGELRCKEVVAEDLSLCTVKSGGVEIQTAVDNEEKLIVKTRPGTFGVVMDTIRNL